MKNRRNKLILAALLLLLLGSLGTNGWQYIDRTTKQVTIDSLLDQESELRENLWEKSQEISRLMVANDSLFNLLALSRERIAADSLKIERFLLDIAQLNSQIETLQKEAFSGVDRAHREFYEKRIAAETEKLAILRAQYDELQAELTKQRAHSRKLSSDLNQIQDYFDELSDIDLIQDFVQFDAKGQPVNIVDNAIGKVKLLQGQLDKSNALLQSYENEPWAKSMKKQIENYKEKIEGLNIQVQEYETILNTAIVASGNREFLKQQNLLTVRRRFGRSDINDFHPENLRADLHGCSSVDTRASEFMVNASGKIVDLFPPRSRTCYNIINDVGDPSRKKIVVTNPKVFWESKSLIIVTD